jgi:hypothetical protein
VNVTANQQIADLESSTVGSLVDRETIESLPLANHNFTQIIGLSPGVAVDQPNAAQPGSGTQNVASDGATPLSNNIQFNGNFPMKRPGNATIGFVLLATLSAVAQTPGTGAISGTVFDPAHRAIAGAVVTTVEQATHTARSVKTGAEGDFRVPLLPPGDYVITIAAAGFAPGTIPEVQVAAGEVRSLDATL